MALVVKDRVRETSTTTGTGTFTLAGAVSGFQTFSSAIGNTNTTYYTIIGGTEWETGLGTVAAGTLARTTVLESSNAGSAVNFSAGTKDVFGTYPASKALYKDASDNAIGLGTVAATTTLTSAVGLPLSTGVTGTLPIANGGTGTTATAHTSLTTNVTGTLPVANGGTSLATLTANNVLLGNGTSAPTFVAPSTSGNLLTSNGTTWTSSTPATPNTAGGATTVSQGTSLTLTSASNKVQNVNLTAASLFVTLPDATTLSAGGPTFIITNTGIYTITIKLNSGVTLTSLSIGQSTNLTLLSAATSDGTWNTNYAATIATQYAAVTIDSNAMSRASNVGNSGFFRDSLNGQDICITKLTSTTALVTWIRTSNNSVYSVVVTNTSGTITVGTIVQIYNGSTTAAISFNSTLLTGLTTGICFVTRASTAIAVPFSVSGTTITVGTASATFGFYDAFYAGHIVEGVTVMSSTVMLIAYYSASETAVTNTITYNGASAPTLGTASATFPIGRSASDDASGPCPLVTLTATTAQLWYISVASTLSTRVVTISGVSAPTLGTALTQTIGSTSSVGYFSPQAYAYSSTETVLRQANPTNTTSQVYSYTISGTTVTLQNSSTIIFNLGGSKASWLSSTQGVYISTLGTTGVTNDPSAAANVSTKINKYSYVSGDNLYNYGFTTNPLTSYYLIQSITGLSVTSGIVAGYTALNYPAVNAVNFV